MCGRVSVGGARNRVLPEGLASLCDFAAKVWLKNWLFMGFQFGPRGQNPVIMGAISVFVPLRAMIIRDWATRYD